MIIARYLTKEVMGALLVVLGILLLIFISNEFVRYLSSAASGKISGMTVFKIMAMQVPYLSGLLLPAALFMGFLLVYSRMYAESEMTVLTACGMSRLHLLRISIVLALFVLLLDTIINFYISPLLLDYKNKLLAVSGPATLIETVQPGRFMTTPDGNLVYYIQGVSRNHQEMTNIFIAQKEKKSAQTLPAMDDTWSVTSAATGHVRTDVKTQEEWIVANQGFRYLGTAGEAAFKTIQFGTYQARIGTMMAAKKHTYEGLSMSQLWLQRHRSPKAEAEWEWRLSLSLMVPILTLLAIPLSYVRPREGRYAKLLPAILLYALYANLLFVARNWVEQNKVPHVLGMWWLHGLMLLIVLGLWFNRTEWLRLFRKYKQ